MEENEKLFESKIEEYLISPEGGWQKANDSGYCNHDYRGMALDIVTLTDFVNKVAISHCMEVVDGRFAIAAVDPAEGTFNRTTLAQSANYMISIRDIEASFVIGETEDNLCAISARSNGKINVQVILEKMGGGGHFNAAGLQKSGTTIAQLKKELLEAIADYQQQEGSEDESDTLN